MSRLLLKGMWIGLILLLGIATLNFAQDISQTETYGGTGGTSFSENMVQSGGRIREIHVFSGDWIDAIQITYQLPDGRMVSGQRHGGANGRETVFRLDGDEYVVGISGRYGDYMDSITILTNKRSSPRMGGSGGRQQFRIDIPSGYQAVGVAGRQGQYLDAISLIKAPTVLRMESAISGGPGGSSFSDRNLPDGVRISEIRIQSAQVVDGIQAVYTTRDGRTIEGSRYGGSGGRRDTFRLAEDEYITAIYGRFGDYIDSITIVTNRRTSRTFGGNGGRTDYRVDVPQGSRTIGFAGRAGKYLDAIGLIYEAGNSRAVPRRDYLRRLPGRNLP